MTYKFEKKPKYEITKLDDINNYLSESQQRIYWHLISQIQDARESEGKSRYNKYVVVNENEPYANEVWRLIKESEEDKYIKKKIENDEWENADKQLVCKECMKLYGQHASGSFLFPSYHILCNGKVVKT